MKAMCSSAFFAFFVKAKGGGGLMTTSSGKSLGSRNKENSGYSSVVF